MKPARDNCEEPDYCFYCRTFRSGCSHRFVLECVLILCACFVQTGCTYNRTGSILPDVKLIEINDSLNGSANGNTVTPGGF